MPHAIWAPLTAFAATLVIVWWLTRSPVARLALDEPNPRSLHQTPVPRTGGIGIHAGALLAWAMLRPDLPWMLWLALAAMIAVSLADDARGVPVLARLGIHLLASGWLAAGLLHEPLGTAGVLLATLALAWMSNLYNFMDGSDGLAGGMAVIGFSTYGAAAWLAGSPLFALANFSVAAAAAAFLVFNFHPARIFMGDVGSVPLGFLAGALAAVGWIDRAWPWWFPVLVFSLFIADASATLVRRLARGERVWEAHRDHYYQRVVQLGWGHRGTALVAYAVMATCGGLALVALTLPASAQAAILAGSAAAYAGLIAVIGRAWLRRRTENTGVR